MQVECGGPEAIPNVPSKGCISQIARFVPLSRDKCAIRFLDGVYSSLPTNEIGDCDTNDANPRMILSRRLIAIGPQS